MTDEEVDTLLSGVEDNQGQVNYEGPFYFALQIPVCINWNVSLAEFIKIVMSG